MRLAALPSVLTVITVTSLATPVAAKQDEAIKTFRAEVGWNGQVVAETRLRVAGTETSVFERGWPVDGKPHCTPADGVRTFAAASNSFNIRLERETAVRVQGRSYSTMKVFAEWTEYLGMPGGVDSGDCDRFPSSSLSTGVSRTIPMDISQPVTLVGDRGFFLRISKP